MSLGHPFNLFLHFDGPFTFTDGDRCVFRSRVAHSPGIYFWTIRQRKDDTHLIQYVGEIGELAP